ncbi:MAG: hypothetical protein KGJ13_04360 [Patescibacteria group bacterium]|nr:hypothetical protein [Patescibacteria group bacterium]
MKNHIELHIRYYWPNCQRAVVLTGEELRKLVPNYQPHPQPNMALIQAIYFTHLGTFSIN